MQSMRSICRKWKIVQQEAMKLDQPRSNMKEAEEEAKEEVQRLSTALEITTASKVPKVIIVSSINGLGFKYINL